MALAITKRPRKFSLDLPSISTARPRPRQLAEIAIQEALDGKVVDWMAQVSEAQYGGKG
jgi:hypothetical protein